MQTAAKLYLKQSVRFLAHFDTKGEQVCRPVFLNLYSRCITHYILRRRLVGFPKSLGPCGTNEETYLLFQETYLVFQETYLLFQETYFLFQETYLLFQETNLDTSLPNLSTGSTRISQRTRCILVTKTDIGDRSYK
jgi:hypothetical protein